MAMMHLHGGLQGASFVSIYFSILLKFHNGISITINYYGMLVRFLFAKFVMKKKSFNVA